MPASSWADMMEEPEPVSNPKADNAISWARITKGDTPPPATPTSIDSKTVPSHPSRDAESEARQRDAAGRKAEERETATKRKEQEKQARIEEERAAALKVEAAWKQQQEEDKRLQQKKTEEAEARTQKQKEAEREAALKVEAAWKQQQEEEAQAQKQKAEAARIQKEKDEEEARVEAERARLEAAEAQKQQEKHKAAEAKARKQKNQEAAKARKPPEEETPRAEEWSWGERDWANEDDVLIDRLDIERMREQNRGEDDERRSVAGSAASSSDLDGTKQKRKARRGTSAGKKKPLAAGCIGWPNAFKQVLGETGIQAMLACTLLVMGLAVAKAS